MKGVFDQRAFAASAAALLASHKMSDVVWQTYFPELPAKCPELRTVLIDIHRQALNGAPPNLTEARRQVANQFDIQTGTATDWLDLLQELGFLIRQHGGKRHEFQLVPSAQAKSGLFNVGREYFACLRLVAPLLLRNPAFHDRPHEVDMDWIDDIRATLQADVIDYSTKPADPD
ncbi:hypothetical protein [Bosea sp. (in: a-proteobacteria)]|uniref:hypothetical protein n=1 Tax=Bosea sp. (in: a-proteobacteria) TaxID=1871050 RepID=UPI003561B990